MGTILVPAVMWGRIFVPKGAQHDQHPTNQALAKVRTEHDAQYHPLQKEIVDQHIICHTNYRLFQASSCQNLGVVKALENILTFI